MSMTGLLNPAGAVGIRPCSWCWEAAVIGLEGTLVYCELCQLMKAALEAEFAERERRRLTLHLAPRVHVGTVPIEQLMRPVYPEPRKPKEFWDRREHLLVWSVIGAACFASAATMLWFGIRLVCQFGIWVAR